MTPISEESRCDFRALAVSIEDAIAHRAGRRLGFVFLVFDPADPEQGVDLANVLPDTAAAALRAAADRIEHADGAIPPSCGADRRHVN